MAIHYAISLSAFGLLLAWFVATKYRRHVAIAKFSSEHGCLPASRYPQFESIIGWGLLRTMIKDKKEHKAIERGKQRMVAYGPTFTATIFTKTVFVTSDPENLKAILATKFDDFGLGQREKVFRPLLGKGIFVSGQSENHDSFTLSRLTRMTADGEAWQHSRALVRPAFTRSQVAETEFFEPHFQRLLKRIPPGGSTVDLGPLFIQLTLGKH